MGRKKRKKKIPFRIELPKKGSRPIGTKRELRRDLADE